MYIIYFMQIYKLAANNIYDNTREVVPKETLRTLVCKMLDEVSKIICVVNLIDKKVLANF